MAYAAPAGSTKLVDAASVNAAATSTPALVPIKSSRSPVTFYVSCNKAHTLSFGTVGQNTTTLAELDHDPAYQLTGLAALATHGTRKYVFWPDAQAGYAWCTVTNNDSSNAATVTVYGQQL